MNGFTFTRIDRSASGTIDPEPKATVRRCFLEFDSFSTEDRVVPVPASERLSPDFRVSVALLILERSTQQAAGFVPIRQGYRRAFAGKRIPRDITIPCCGQRVVDGRPDHERIALRITVPGDATVPERN